MKLAEIAKKPKKGAMHWVATAIVNGRFVILAAFILAAIYCILSVGRVRINSDLTAFLPEKTETRQGLSIMEDEFITYGSADIMVANITSDTAQKLADDIAAMDHVTGVTYDDTTTHYKNASALLSVSFDGTEDDEDVIAAMQSIREKLSDYDVYISSDIGSDYSAELASEMLGVLLIALVVIVAVLMFTSHSWFDVVIFAIVFIFAGLMNMGTNFWLGEISSITNSIAIILQLALAIDYAIIFCHRYQDEVKNFPTEREALIEALAKSIVEIASSSLTTISGLIALTLMQFRLGYDLGMVLTKGILCSLITVFLLMPCVISLFPRALRKTAHKILVPDIRPWGVFLTRSKFCFVLIFALILPGAIICSSRTEYVFSDRSIDELVYSESRATMHKITDTFDDSTTIAVLVPHGEYEKQAAVLEAVQQLDGVKSAMGLANIEIKDGSVLTDKFTPRMFAELLDIDIEQAELLFQAYGVNHEEYQAVFGSVDEYEVVLLDMFEYLFDIIDRGLVNLDSETMDTVDELRETLRIATDQLRGENYDRLVLTATVPVEGEQSTALVEEIRTVAERQFGQGNVVLVGDITSTRDLSDSYNSDLLKINLLTIAFIFVILLFTFRSLVGAVLLVLVIQGSIWMNFSFPYLNNFHTSFITYMIVSAIQMGATIDYAIVIMSHYQALKAEKPPKEAMADAVNESFATVLTSGSIMSLAGFLIGFRVSDVYVGHIGLAVGRGALISMVLVMTVLPQLILLCDKLIDRTRFTLGLQKREEEA